MPGGYEVYCLNPYTVYFRSNAGCRCREQSRADEAATFLLELRWDENWSYLRDHAQRSDYFDPVKHIPLNSHGWYLSIGGESRTRLEYFRNATFGSAPGARNGFLIQRHLLHGDVHLGAHARVFLQLQSGLEHGRVGGPRATDKDVLDVHQAFVDLNTSENPKRAVTFRLGRQELEFGSGHYFSASEVFKSSMSGAVSTRPGSSGTRAGGPGTCSRLAR